MVRKKHKVLPKKIGILVINLGSPRTPTAGAVKIFLREFLSDPRVVPLAKGFANFFWWPLLRFVILPIRSPQSAKKYRSIWLRNISPLHHYTDSIAMKLQKQFGADIIVRSSYRYGDRPSKKNIGKNIGGGNIETEIKNLTRLGCRRVVVLQLYPHYSTSTTASVVDEIGRVLKTMQHQPSINIVPPYFDHADFIALLKQSIINHFKNKKMPQQIIASHHGIPSSFVKNGDPYSCQAKKTTRLLAVELAAELGRDKKTITVAFQSRFGKNEWVKPYAVDMVKKMATDGCQSLAIIAPSFAVDCLETLEEINMELRHEFLQHHKNPKQAIFHYIPCLNDTAPAILFYKKILSPFL